MNCRYFLLAFGLVTFSFLGIHSGFPTSHSATALADEGVAASKALSSHSSDQTKSKPIIGIASLTSDNYVRAIRQCGGVPVVLPNTDGSDESIPEYLELLDGLVMPGGADIPPAEYGEEPHPTTSVLSNERYQFEKAMIKAWIDQTDKPLLGICLGGQWVNVAHGGSLIQDLPSETGGHLRGIFHKVELDPDSRLCKIFGETEFEVNSYHHQAVRNVGEGLRAVAKSPDGVIEATETTDPDRFLIGVQWHPEKMMPENKLQAKLIKAFIDATVKSKKQEALTHADID
ncbi:gamma-glutamyl-gamma-aminobutyrate hydrolase family protein [Calycomorphotria hydatis]|uniref:Glutamine amidotransferase n=1 Tax=Calycomorphotria hydatis TaxID=2528027 RepID=A0A517T8I7_9PLAN|nr:gamma-glutamyl-gamma-aminobutyrate hydrolase family protein [Calycomorphotria hydatis]QDT64687.1 Putative glutamine amidotransferase [Calycomorphotria hydatis]